MLRPKSFSHGCLTEIHTLNIAADRRDTMKPTWLVAAFTLVLLLFPAAEAARVPEEYVEGRIKVANVGEVSGDGQQSRVGIAMGQVRVTGQTGGVFFFADHDGAQISDAARVEVYDVDSGPGKVDPREYLRTGRPIIAAHTNAVITVPPGADFVYDANQTLHTVAVTSPFAFVVPVLPPENVGNDRIEVTPVRSVLVSGPNEAQVAMDAGDESQGALFVPDDAARVTVTSDEAPEGAEYAGGDYVLRVMRTGMLEVDGETAMIPMNKTAQAILRPATEEALVAGFDLGRLTRAASSFEGEKNESKPSGEGNDDFANSLAPVFNGAIVGNPEGSVRVRGNTVDFGTFTLIRYSEFKFTPGADEDFVAYSAHGPLVFAGDDVQTGASAVGSGVFSLPVLSLILWILAIGAVIAGFVVKPIVPKTPAHRSMKIRMVSILTHVGALVIAFLLWDLELRAFFGSSILSAMGGPGQNALAVVAGVQLATFSFALFLFGLPIALMANSLLKLADLRRAKGVGRGVGYMAAWALGAIHLPLMMAPLLRILANQVGAGFV